MARAALIAGNAPIHWPGRHRVGRQFPDNPDRDRVFLDQRGRSPMRRREFIAGLSSAAAWPVVARAISRFAVKSRCACEWDGWGRLSDDGPGQNILNIK